MGERTDDAWRWLQSALAGRPVPPLVIVIGLGRGELLRALEERDVHARVLALEPRPYVAGSFLTRGEWNGWRTSGRLVYLHGPDYAGADDAWRIFPDDPDDHIILADPALARAGGNEALQAAQTLKAIVFGVRANAQARQQFAPRYLTQALRNAPAIVAGHDVRALRDAYRGRPAVIAAAGPSLDALVSPLRDLEGRALLIAADTALRPLLTAGLAPHLVVGLDPGALNATHFHYLPDCRRTWLVSESALDPSAGRLFGERTFWFRVADHEPWPWYRELGFEVGLLEVWGSVVTAAFQVAVLAGCDPIVFVGADLAYSEGRPYCRGSTYEFRWARGTAAGHDLAELWRGCTTPNDAVRVPDLRGVETTTTPVLLAFRDWLVAHAVRSGRRVINATGAGLLVGNGIEQRSLADVLTDRRPVPSPAMVVGDCGLGVDPAALAARFREQRAEIVNPASAAAARWAAFSGRDWDPAATARALDEAVLALSGTGDEAPPDDAPEASRRVLRRLPEATARWRAALSGRNVPPTPDDDARPETGDEAVAALVDAFDVVVRVLVTVERDGLDVPPATPAVTDPAQSVGAVYAWPAGVAFDVQIVEGLLGLAARRPVARAADTFFTAPVTLREPLAQLDAPPAAARTAPLACALLALEWALCAQSLEAAASPEAMPSIDMVRALEHALSAATPSIADGRPDQVGSERVEGVLRLSSVGGEPSVAVELPIALDVRALVRAHTGAVHDARFDEPGATLASVAWPLDVRARTPERSASIGFRTSPRTEASGHDRGGGVWAALHIRPRVLTDAGMPRANIAYTTAQGAVCVGHFATSSVVVGPDGSIAPGHAWPQPMIGELPLAGNGLVAWSVGGTAWGSPEPGYVMHRAGPDEPASLEPLPFKPASGLWWRDRLFWTCVRTGIGSWAPGVAPTLSLAHLMLFSVGVRDDGLLLASAMRDAGGVLHRQRSREAWRWRGEGPLEAASLDPLGATTCRAVSAGGWVATVYPQADAIALASPGQRVRYMTCYYPLKAAWLGGSLLVSTVHGEVLLFEHLVERLGEMGTL
jgi:hypothetical protein